MRLSASAAFSCFLPVFTTPIARGRSWTLRLAVAELNSVMNSRLCSSLEPLESRIAPAGLVKVAIAGGGVMLTGDAMDNVIEIDPGTSGQLHLIGASGTQFQLGTSAPTADLLVMGFSGDLKVALGDGADTLTLDKGTLPHNVVLDVGTGTNTIKIGDMNNRGDHVIGGSLTLAGKAGADTVNIAANQFSVGKDLTISLGDGANTVGLDAVALSVAGKFKYTGGIGVANLSVAGGKGADVVTVSADNATFLKDLTGVSGGSLNISTTITTNLIVGGKLTLIGGPGNDIFSVSGAGTIVGATTLNLGGGNGDRLTLTGAGSSVLNFLGPVKI